jgi:uracil phosphoribosyltransferase
MISTAIFGQTQFLNELVYEIRNPQTDPANFRNILEKIGEHLAKEILEELSKKEVKVTTLTGAEATHLLTNETPILVTILRAGLPLYTGVQKIFPQSEVGFLAMSRDETTLKAQVDYIALPNLKDKTVIIADTMLATGGSLLDAINLIEQQQPKQIYVVSAIASQPGIDRIITENPSIKIFAGTVDPTLNEKGYIVPGLGDAGDRAYGKKYSPN